MRNKSTQRGREENWSLIISDRAKPVKFKKANHKSRKRNRSTQKEKLINPEGETDPLKRETDQLRKRNRSTQKGMRKWHQQPRTIFKTPARCSAERILSSLKHGVWFHPITRPRTWDSYLADSIGFNIVCLGSVYSLYMVCLSPSTVGHAVTFMAYRDLPFNFRCFYTAQATKLSSREREGGRKGGWALGGFNSWNFIAPVACWLQP